MKHIAVIKKKPEFSGKNSTPDGAINGNGDLAVILGNSENGLRIYICKIDLWYGISMYNKGGLRPLGYVDIDIPDYLYANYYVEQDMDKGEIRCRFAKGEEKCVFNIKVCKTDNIILIENKGNTSVSPALKVYEAAKDGKKGEEKDGDLSIIFRSFDDKENVFETHCYAAMKELENRYAVVVATNHDLDKENGEGVREFVISKADALSDESLDRLEEAHLKGWEDFYKKSSVTLSDEYFELRWYASQYFLACGCGNGKFAPGLFSNFVTVEEPAWHSDYHLNYNYQAPFYAACSSNHIELTDTYHVPLEEFMENGRKDAEKFGCKGIILPVGIGPKGIYTEYTPILPHWFERLYLGQKSNAIHPADIMVFRWKTTRDKEYAKSHAYPYIKECLQFFEDYATFENGRYSINDDAAHEVPMYRPTYDPKKREYRFIHDKNNSLTLGMLRLCIPAAIDMAKELGIDEDKQKIWQNMLDKLSPFATTPSFYGRIYRYTEKGQRTNNDNDVGLQHIYPGNCIGLSSNPKELKIARNTFNSRKRICWHDANANSSYYPMAAHLGIDPKEIIKELKKDRDDHEFPNLLYCLAAGGYEYTAIVANTINEMALQSFQDAIRIFPNWNNDIDCSFTSLRAEGAFLVSSSIKSGKIGKTEIFCEVGGKLRIINPFDFARITTPNCEYDENKRRIEIITKPGDVITIESI